MKYPLFIAKRFIASKKQSGFISFIITISIVGVTIGVATLIIAISILNGFEDEITNRAVSVSSHIQITSFKQGGITSFDSLTNKLKEINFNYAGFTPYVLKEAVIKFRDKTEGVMIKGVNPEDKLFSSRRKISEGKEISINDSAAQLIIGDKLAQRLGIKLNDKVFVIASVGLPSVSNTPNIKPFIISGIYESGLKEYDDVLVYMNISSAQNLFSMGHAITGTEIILNNPAEINAVTELLKRKLGHPYRVKSIFQIYRGLFTWVDLQKEPIPIILGLVVIVASFNMIAFLLMIVLEKTENIGILKSMGAKNKDILFIFLCIGIFITLSGTISGNILGYGLCYLQDTFQLIKIPDIYYMSKVPMKISYQTGLIVTAITFILGLIVTIIPSYLSSRLNPIASIRFK